MRTEGPVYRPPSEAASTLLHVTYGCSHNLCGFCAMYRHKKFRVRPLEEVFEDIAAGARALPATDKVFLLDGDAMTLAPARLHPVLDALRAAFPRLRRVAAYSNASSVLSKTDAELASLRDAGLGILYFGLESGDDPTLRRIEKGATAAEVTEAVQRTKGAGIKTSVMALLGIAGRERWRAHAEATAQVASAMSPRFLSFLTATPVPDTPFLAEVEAGRVTLPTPEETLEELEAILQRLDCQGTVFRSNHASNYLPLGGRLPQDKDRLVAEVGAARRGELGLRPEWLRGL
ncbi:MAG: radical SAM protein [Planctomycetaceae bacterium]